MAVALRIELGDGVVDSAVEVVRTSEGVVELWPKLGDGGVRKAAYRGG
jgi:hypothetical protein